MNYALHRLLGLALIGALVLALAVIQDLGGPNLFQSINDLLILLIGALAGIALQLIFVPARTFGRKSDADVILKAFSINTDHLQIYFSNRIGAPKNPALPYYLLNTHRPKDAYLVPDRILELAKRNIIEWFTRDGEKALKKYFDERGITIQPRTPTIEELI